MKTLIACYSYSGLTLKVAKVLKKEIKADLTEIKTKKDRCYIFKLLDAKREKKVEINPCKTDLAEYESLILCCPVWAGKTPSAINQNLSKLQNFKGKKFGIFVTSRGNRSQKATIQMREYLDIRGMIFQGQMRILTKDIKKDKFGEIFDIFAKKFITELKETD